MEDLIRSTNDGIEISWVERDGKRVPKLRGLAAVYYSGSPGSEYQLAGNLFERIAPGAFDDVLRSNPDIIATINHDVSKILGRTPKTLKVWTDQRGLNYEVELGNSSIAQDAIDLVSRSDISKSSFRFRVDPADKAQASFERDGTKDVLLIKKIAALRDVAIVTTPAYADTAVSIRAAHTDWLARMETQRRIELLKNLR